jgi:hypothetical protein
MVRLAHTAVNLLFLGPWLWVIVSTLIFVVVHFLTNLVEYRIGVYNEKGR